MSIFLYIGGKGWNSGRISLHIDCTISYYLHMFVQMKQSMFLCIGRWYKNKLKISKRQSEGANWRMTDKIVTIKRRTMDYETSQSKQDKSFSNTGVIISVLFLCENCRKHHMQQIRCFIYTDYAYVAHGPGDDDHYLAVLCGCFGSDILLLYYTCLYVMDCDITAWSKWYYSFYRAYDDPCKIIFNA